MDWISRGDPLYTENEERVIGQKLNHLGAYRSGSSMYMFRANKEPYGEEMTIPSEGKFPIHGSITVCGARFCP